MLDRVLIIPQVLHIPNLVSRAIFRLSLMAKRCAGDEHGIYQGSKYVRVTQGTLKNAAS